MVIFKLLLLLFFFLQNLSVTNIAFFATNENKIITYVIPTGPSMLFK